MKLFRAILIALLTAVAGAQTPPPALSREALSVTAFPTHLAEQRKSEIVRWYPMLNDSLWIARDASGRVIEEWDRFTTGTWRERRTGRTIRQVSMSWRFENGDTLRRVGQDAEIRDSSGFRVSTIRRVP